MVKPKTGSKRGASAKRPGGAKGPSGSPGVPPGSRLVAVGLAVGLGIVQWRLLLDRAFGRDPAADVVLAIVAAIGFGFGIVPSVARARWGTIGLGPVLIALGIGTVVLDRVGSVGTLLAALGAEIDAGPVARTLARAAVGALALVPLGFGLGTTLRRLLGTIPDGPGGALAASLAVTAGAAGMLVANLALVMGVGGPTVFASAAGVLLVLTGLVSVRGERSPAENAGESGDDPATPSNPALAGFAAAFLAVTAGFLAWRTLVPAIGSDLPGLPVGSTLFAAGATLGALVATIVARSIRTIGGPVGAGFAALAGSAALLATTRFAALPGRIAAIDPPPLDLVALARAVAGEATGMLLPAAFFGGAALAILSAGVPVSARARAAWGGRVGLGAILGGVAGTMLPRLALPAVDLDALVRIGAGIAAAAATGTILAAGFRGRLSVVRAGAALLGLIAIAVATTRLPSLDRRGLLVESDLHAATSPIAGVQKSWPAFDRDGPVDTWTIQKRGHRRRLFVNGRWEMGDASGIKSQGLLGHLPLVLHPDPRRVLLFGSANAFAVAAALSHPIDRLDCVVSGRLPVLATVKFGRRAEDALRDARLHFRLGDPSDLLARAGAYDVIVDQASGAWGERAAQTATREFLQSAHDRLTDFGVYCRWVGGQTLTKPGIEALLATVSAVFPRVEVWAGQGGDILVLATKSDRAHDVERILQAYSDPRVEQGAAAAWVGEPLTLLSQFLVGDATVRRIAAGAPVHGAREEVLLRAEAENRRREPPVNPVPGLVQIRDDVMRALRNATADGFAEAVRRAVAARDREYEGLDHELAGDRPAAARSYADGLDLNPIDGALRRAFATSRSLQGIEYAHRQKSIAAHAHLREAVEIDGTYAQGLGNLGNFLMLDRAFDYAVSVTEAAVLLEPEDDVLHAQMGMIWKRRGYYDQAAAWYEKALELNPRNVEAAIGLTDAVVAMDDVFADYEAGLAFLEPFTRWEPDHPTLLQRLDKLRTSIEWRDSNAQASEDASSTLGEMLSADPAEAGTPPGTPAPVGPPPKN